MSFVPNYQAIQKLGGCGRLVSNIEFENLATTVHGFSVLTSFLFSLVWTLGNLARATYVGSSDYVWPYSYNECDPKKQRAQEINACQKVHHYGMEPNLGRGAPEIDVIEAMQGPKEKLPNTNITRPYQSCSLQVRNRWIPSKSAVLRFLKLRFCFRLHLGLITIVQNLVNYQRRLVEVFECSL